MKKTKSARIKTSLILVILCILFIALTTTTRAQVTDNGTDDLGVLVSNPAVHDFTNPDPANSGGLSGIYDFWWVFVIVVAALPVCYLFYKRKNEE